jgi:hypothetical protein
MQDGGRVEGRFTCLSAPPCAERGFFTDFIGHRGDPSLGPRPAAARHGRELLRPDRHHRRRGLA